jgi:hypothetical protein
MSTITADFVAPEWAAEIDAVCAHLDAFHDDLLAEMQADDRLHEDEVSHNADDIEVDLGDLLALVYAKVLPPASTEGDDDLAFFKNLASS